MSAAMQLSGLAVMQFKHFFRVRRPADRSPLVQPVLLTPGHGSYPAGHSTQCGFLAAILADLAGNSFGADLGGQLDALAARIGQNRVVAGLHYQADIDDGLVLGKALAEKHFIPLAKPGKDAAGNAVVDTPLRWLWDQAASEQWK